MVLKLIFTSHIPHWDQPSSQLPQDKTKVRALSQKYFQTATANFPHSDSTQHPIEAPRKP